MITQIIGVDCATKLKRVGIAAARRDEPGFRLFAATACSGAYTPAGLVGRWVEEAPGSTLLALDAPLGWPTDLGKVLAAHSAGQSLAPPANIMFRRATDRDVAARFGKTPLDVGADRIARTAHCALALLERLRSDLAEPIPLAWSQPLSTRVAAIEVYPAATMLAHGVAIRGYKGLENTAARAAIHTLVNRRLVIDPAADLTTWSTDTLDAVVCVLAGADFATGAAQAPPDAELAAKEGWIWVRGPSGSS